MTSSLELEEKLPNLQSSRVEASIIIFSVQVWLLVFFKTPDRQKLQFGQP